MTKNEHIQLAKNADIEGYIRMRFMELQSLVGNPEVLDQMRIEAKLEAYTEMKVFCQRMLQADEYNAAQQKRGESGYSKPPMGLMPEFIHNQNRVNSIINATSRYMAAGRPVPAQWIAEYNRLVAKDHKTNE